MQLINQTTGMVEYDGPQARFPGVDAYRHEEVEAEFEIVLSKAEQRDQVRQHISERAGDVQTMLGTTADATQILLYALCNLTAKLSTANSLADVRAATESIAPIAGAFLARVESGQVKLPFMAKGLESVMDDIEQRATAVSNVLAGMNKSDVSQNENKG